MGFPGRYGWNGPAHEALELPRFKDVFEAWASRQFESGRNRRGSVYFIGPTIYSYGPHFPMARFVKNPHGRPALLFTSRRYEGPGTTGATTECHKGSTWGAAHGWKAPRHLQKMRVFHVANPDRPPAVCVISFLSRLNELAEQAKTARSRRIWHLDAYDCVVREARSFMRFFDIEQKLPLDPLVTHPEFRAHALTLQKLSYVKRSANVAVSRADRRRRLAAETGFVALRATGRDGTASLIGKRNITIE